MAPVEVGDCAWLDVGRSSDAHHRDSFGSDLPDVYFFQGSKADDLVSLCASQPLHLKNTFSLNVVAVAVKALHDLEIGVVRVQLSMVSQVNQRG